MILLCAYIISEYSQFSIFYTVDHLSHPVVSRLPLTRFVFAASPYFHVIFTILLLIIDFRFNIIGLYSVVCLLWEEIQFLFRDFFFFFFFWPTPGFLVCKFVCLSLEISIQLFSSLFLSDLILTMWLLTAVISLYLLFLMILSIVLMHIHSQQCWLALFFLLLFLTHLIYDITQM